MKKKVKALVSSGVLIINLDFIAYSKHFFYCISKSMLIAEKNPVSCIFCITVLGWNLISFEIIKLSLMY